MKSQAHATPAKHRLNPRKLLLSKWTATQPQNREKHFLVTELFCDEDGTVLQIELQAVLNQRSQRLDWHALENPEEWRMGWK
ncbi:TIGR02450 family Trp-rich protein [Pseudomonas guineae]|uniref:TIGR02450 family Trp-rich protein n=1 Tax=Pseudomonas guineae TaxID=425504 RepID=UPI003D07C0BB